MTARPLPVLSSGDLLADRRLALAGDYAAAGEPAAAVDLCEQALERAPDWAAGWFMLGEFREAAARADAADREALGRAAVEAYLRARSLDPDDRCGATLRLARAGAIPAPNGSPPAHVRDLFDGYAARFEASLVGALGYRGPEQFAAMLARVAPERRFAAAIDLGCGTGLLAPVVRPRVERLVGVDLSPAMLDRARSGGFYDELVVGEIVADLTRRPPATFDLILAADVFCYVGDLAPVFAAVARVARPDALVLFTTESVEESEPGGGVVLRDSLRWAHRPRHVALGAAACGLAVAAETPVVVRRDRGCDVGGRLTALVPATIAERPMNGG